MTEAAPAPWTPDRRWADPLIAFLALLCLLLGGAALRQRSAAPKTPSASLSLEGRTREIALAGARFLPLPAGPQADPATLAPRLRAPWDRAMLAVLLAETGKLEEGFALAKEGPAPFLKVWEAAYLGGAALPDAAERRAVAAALRRGYAAQALEARLRAREGVDPAPALAAARDWALLRLLALGAAGLGLLALALGGLVFGLIQAATWARAPRLPQPAWRLGGRALALVFLGWILAFLLSGTVAALLLAPFPALHPLALPLGYLFHASVGLGLLLRAEGLSLRAMLRRAHPLPLGRTAAWALGFWSLAALLVVLVGLALAPLSRDGNPAQKELFDQMAGLKGWAVAASFLAVAGLAPLWEELLFRGLLLPWVGARLQAAGLRRGAWGLALAAVALAFGAIHLNLQALPALATLGLVLGLCCLRSGSLLAAVLVHALWNGGTFLFTRLLIG